MTSASPVRVVVLGTGGTIAGTSASPQASLHYESAQLPVHRLLQTLAEAVPGVGRLDIESEQLAQVDSKDMDHALWARIARRCTHHLQRADVTGVVLTHGTDTLEETAWLLHRVAGADKPLVLTAAMRPATALGADGPRNLLDALCLAAQPGARGVLVAMAGRAWAGAEVRKVHTTDLDAFHAGGRGPVALVRDGFVETLRPWPAAAPHGHDVAGRAEAQAPAASTLPQEEGAWPWVEIVASHAGASGRAVELLCDAGVRGLVVAATGNGSLHHALEAALERAEARGVAILRASRCAAGGIVQAADAKSRWASAEGLTPAQARVELMLRLIEREAGSSGP